MKTDEIKKYLKETKILDYTDSSIQRIVEQRHWRSFDDIFKIKAIYNFVRDEIKFGYNNSSTLKSSQVLRDGYGTGNTKTILLMSFLRAANIPCRVHGFIVDKSKVKGILQGLWYRLSPQKLLYSCVEVFVDGDWYILEGVMLDRAYVNGLLKLKPDMREALFAFGLYGNSIENLLPEKELNDKYIIDNIEIKDLGVYESPDQLHLVHAQPFSAIQKFFFHNLVKHRLNKELDDIRNARDE